MQPRLLFDTFVPYGYPRVVIVGQFLSSSFILFIYLFIYFARPKRDFFIETREIEKKKKKKKRVDVGGINVYEGGYGPSWPLFSFFSLSLVIKNLF